MVATEIWRGAYEVAEVLPSFIGNIIIQITDSIKRDFMWSSQQGARTQVYLSVSPDVVSKRINGQYYHPVTTPMPQTDHMKNRTLQDQFWAFSQEFLDSVNFDQL